MPEDIDRYFLGQQDSSTPASLLGEGVVSRLINGSFRKGVITNAISLDEQEFNYAHGNDKRVFASNVTYGELLRKGDFQLGQPLENVNGKFLVLVISEIIFLVDLSSNLAYDITPQDAFLPDNSLLQQLSYIDNNGETYGVGGYATIFNYPNLPIFITPDGARLSNTQVGEMPIARLGASAGERVAIVSGDNILMASDPFGGAAGLAPLTFHQMLDASTGFKGQTFVVGSAIEMSKVTNMTRVPKSLSPNQTFLAQNLLISSNKHKYIAALGAPRDTWAAIQFLTYVSTGEGIAGPWAATTVGDSVVYISSTGRIKLLSQDQMRETSMMEEYLDDTLGQYIDLDDSLFFHRKWYSKLDHSRSVIKFNRDRLYATVYPMKVPAVGKYGQKLETISHRALAVASIDSTMRIGSKAAFSWEGFNDSVNPVSIINLGVDTYVISKDKYGHIRYFKENKIAVGVNKTTVFTRGYLSKAISKSKSLLDGSIYFRRPICSLDVAISYLVNGKWVPIKLSKMDKQFNPFSLKGQFCKTNCPSIPLRMEIDHKGALFELESVIARGELHNDG